MFIKILFLIHIGGAAIGLLSGFMAMVFRKGSGWHGAAGSVFFVSMLSMSATAAYIAAFVRPVPMNLVVALLTFYLVSTAWRAAKNRDGALNAFDVGAFLFILADAIAAYGFAIGSEQKGRAMVCVIFGTVALLCAVSDVRMLRRGNLAEPARVVRHLWRMCLALLIATMSFYPGQAKLLPMWLRETKLMLIPHVLLIGSMIWWRYRMSARKRAQRLATPPVPVTA